MDKTQWLTLTLFISGIALSLVGILFSWLRNSIVHLEQRMEKRFSSLDAKLDQSNRDNKQEIRDVRNQVQASLKCIADTRKDKESR